jgi:hypothetical protein
MNILTQISEELTYMGYASLVTEDTLTTNLGNVPVIFNYGEKLRVTCQLTPVADLQEENLGTFALAALMNNNVISPFSVALLDGGEEGIQDDIITLITSVNVSQLGISNVGAFLRSLIQAIELTTPLLEIGRGKVAELCNG